MKIEADVKLHGAKAEDYGQTHVKVNVDEDYVEADWFSVYEWVANELYDMYGISFDAELDFTIENIDEVIEDLRTHGEED